MEFLADALLQLLGEILLQVLVELMFEVGFRSLASTMRRGPKSPILSTIGFMLWGTIAGGLSLLLFPHSPIASPMLRKSNLLITPTLVGALMAIIGRARSKRGQSLVRLDRFGYAFVFAFCMAIVRFIWAT